MLQLYFWLVRFFGSATFREVILWIFVSVFLDFETLESMELNPWNFSEIVGMFPNSDCENSRPLRFVCQHSKNPCVFSFSLLFVSYGLHSGN